MSEDELEALSRSYAADAAVIFKLRSGRYACFNRQFRLELITASAEEVMLFIENRPASPLGVPCIPTAAERSLAQELDL